MSARAPLVVQTPTPAHRLPGLARRLEMDPDCLWVKREDMTGLAGGGNKARKLQLLVDDALAQDADSLVTGGGAQSNHARSTAAAASIAGLRCVLALGRPSQPDDSGNVLLDRIFDADIRWIDEREFDALEAAVTACCDELESDGHRPYRIPLGGSSPLGASSYIDVARETTEQVDPELVVVAAGTGGTHAGLAAGFGDHERVLGVDVGARPEIAHAIQLLAAEAAKTAGAPAPKGEVRIVAGQVGDGYGAPTDAALEALHLTARRDGVLLDPVYTAKAMAGLIAARRNGDISATTRTVFIHTGGLPGLLAQRYTAWASGS